MCTIRSLKEGFRVYTEALKSGFSPTLIDYNQLITLYSRNNLTRDAAKLFDEMPQRDVWTWNSIIIAHVKSHDLDRAQSLFDSAPCKDLITYTTMVSAYMRVDPPRALHYFVEMHRGGIPLDSLVLASALKVSAKLSRVCYGRQVHSQTIKTGCDSSGLAFASLIEMYSNCGPFFLDARRVFDEGDWEEKEARNAMVVACCIHGDMKLAEYLFWSGANILSWNMMIRGFVQIGRGEKSLEFFTKMRENQVDWNENSFSNILRACSSLKNLRIGKEIHGRVLKTLFVSNPFIISGIVDVYCKCSSIKYAEAFHDSMGKTQSPFSVTSLITAHSSQGDMGRARDLFDTLPEKIPSLWTALFSGFLKANQTESVFALLNEYKTLETTIPNPLILVSVLGACAIQAAINPGKQTHCYILRMKYTMEVKLVNAMVDMYSKCGSIDYAEKTFFHSTTKDIVLYNVLIGGYGNHGKQMKATRLFEDMVKSGIRPNGATFIALLSGCCHSGLVDLGEQYFSSMSKDYAISPEINHYACMVDLYGRANRLEDAVALMKSIPVQLDGVIWGVFLNACMMNRNTVFAGEVEENLLRIEEGKEERYVQLANFYAADGKWDEMGRIRKDMREKEMKMKRSSGCSWLCVENKAHVFTSGDTWHPQSKAIYSILRLLTQQFSSYYICNTTHQES